MSGGAGVVSIIIISCWVELASWMSRPVSSSHKIAPTAKRSAR